MQVPTNDKIETNFDAVANAKTTLTQVNSKTVNSKNQNRACATNIQIHPSHQTHCTSVSNATTTFQ